jgi:hypothetical protein
MVWVEVILRSSVVAEGRSMPSGYCVTLLGMGEIAEPD